MSSPYDTRWWGAPGVQSPQGVAPYNQTAPGPSGGMQIPPQVIDPRTAQPALNPPGLEQYAENVPNWRRIQAYYPELLIPNHPNISVSPRWYSVSTGNVASANGTYTTNLRFEMPTTVYAITAGTFYTDITVAMAAGTQIFWQQNNVFQVMLSRMQGGDRLTTDTVLGGCIAGTASFPSLIGAGGWMFNTGGSMNITITNLVANCRIDMSFLVMEIRGPANFTWPALQG